MTDLAYQRETFAGAWEEARALAQRDYDEMIPYKDAAPHEVDEARYRQMEALGLLRAYTVRRAGRLVGYLVYMVSAGSLHSKQTKRAANTDWWLDPAERRGLTGIRLLDFAEAALKAEGVVLMATTVTTQSTAAAAVLRLRGHDLQELTYMKVLNA